MMSGLPRNYHRPPNDNKKEVNMIRQGDTVWTINVDIQTEDDWNKFIGITDWFIDGAPIEEIKQHVLANPGWAHFLDIKYIHLFTMSSEYCALIDSGLAVAIKKCVVTLEGYVSPNDVWTASRG